MTERHHAFTGDQVTDPTGLHVGVGPLVDPIRSRDAGIQGDVVMLLGFLAPGHRRIIPVDVDAIGRMLGIRDRADQIAQVVHIAPVDAAASGAAIQQVGRHGPFDELAQRDAHARAFRLRVTVHARKPVGRHARADVVHVLQRSEDVGHTPQIGQIVTGPLRGRLIPQIRGFRGSGSRQDETRLLQFDEPVRFGQVLEHRVQRHRPGGLALVG